MAKINVKLLRRIQKHILAEPRRYNQNATIIKAEPGAKVRPDRGEDVNIVPACGTVACIGGWADILGAARGAKIREFSFDRARKLLGLDEDQGIRLFDYITDETRPWLTWPDQFTDAYLAAKTPRGRARVAVRRIDHFIATKGVE
jgi:hypothetical protein